ncbi:S41 family peptidase, partial [Streptomyces sp. NPDC056697]|uniref:S41 family peptidase n=1 Tax=Streptomyces sp. NPDC056697 TaxID=3345915 RepID=UPI0036D24CF8
IDGLDLYEATLKIRGEKGSTVRLEIERQGLREPLVVEVKRDEIPQITVYGDVKKQGSKNVGYIEITSFSEETAKEFKQQLTEMEKKGIAGVRDQGETVCSNSATQWRKAPLFFQFRKGKAVSGCGVDRSR